VIIFELCYLFLAAFKAKFRAIGANIIGTSSNAAFTFFNCPTASVRVRCTIIEGALIVFGVSSKRFPPAQPTGVTLLNFVYFFV